MTQISWFDPAAETSVAEDLGGRDIVGLMVNVWMTSSARGLPAIELVRLDESVLTLGTDGERAVVIWTNSLGENAHGVGDDQSTEPLIYDYFGSLSEAPADWLTSLTDALDCVRAFLRSGVPDTQRVIFAPD